MGETFILAIEAEFTPSNWTDITADVIDVIPIKWRRGIWSNRPTARTAGTGSLKMLLDNSAKNSGSKLGYYSPEHANARSGFEVGLAIRIKYTYGGTTYFKLHNRMSDANPDHGQYKNRRVSVVALDYMNIISRYKMAQIGVQANKRPDEVMATVIAALPIAPKNTSYDTDPDIYTRALHMEKDGVTAGRAVLNKCALSSKGQAFVIGDLTDGETLRWYSRSAKTQNTALAATINDNMTGLKVIRSQKNIINTVNAITYPVKVEEAITLYTAQREIEVQPGITTKFVAMFTDPSGAGRRVKGSENHETPEAGDHYRASAFEKSGGDDLNASVTVTITIWGANSAKVEITTSAGRVAYVNLLTLIGDGLFTYEPSIYTAFDLTSKDDHGDNEINYPMPYQENPNIGKDFGDFILAWHKDPVNEINSVEFIANTNATLMAAGVSVDIGDRIKIIETVTAVSTEFYVNGVEHIINSGILTVRWLLERADMSTYWLWGVVGNAEMGVNTYFGV